MAAKVFEVGDVLPATTQLRISWTITDTNIPDWDIYNTYFIESSTRQFSSSIDPDFDLGRSLIFVELYYLENKYSLYINGVIINDVGWVSPYTDANGNHAYIDIDTSNWSESDRTIGYIDYVFIDDFFYWEDLNASAGHSITFEENGGSTVTDLTEQTSLPNPLPTTTKANHVFAGWYLDSSFTQKAVAGDELEGNVTLYAKWYTPTTWCQDIADAIREKEGSSGNIKHVDFADRIRELETVSSGIPAYDSLEEITSPTANMVVKINGTPATYWIYNNIWVELLQQSVYSVTYTLSYCTKTSGANYVVANGVLSAVVEAYEDYILPETISMTMGGNAFTDFSYDSETGEIEIAANKIIGNLVITITAEVEREICPECSGNTTITCPTCNGSGDEQCPECGGTGVITCTTCLGTLTITCTLCGGTGGDYCYHPNGVDGDSVNGAYCPDCGAIGNNFQEASDMSVGFIPCSACNGATTEQCPTCQGSGTENCPTCSGSGRVTCSECNGNTTIICPTCNGSGEV